MPELREVRCMACRDLLGFSSRRVGPVCHDYCATVVRDSDPFTVKEVRGERGTYTIDPPLTVTLGVGAVDGQAYLMVKPSKELRVFGIRTQEDADVLTDYASDRASIITAVHRLLTESYELAEEAIGIYVADGYLEDAEDAREELRRYGSVMQRIAG